MKSTLRNVDDHGIKYQALMFVCPGCVTEDREGIHILPVNADIDKPSWDWDGNLEAPTLHPSILTTPHDGPLCHSFLRAGVFEFLPDSQHSMSGTSVPIPDLPDWASS